MATSWGPLLLALCLWACLPTLPAAGQDVGSVPCFGQIGNCASCYQQGKRYKCFQCLPGFQMSKNRSICACPNGQYLSVAGCAPCIRNHYCPYGSQPVPCPEPLIGPWLGAKTIKGCVNPPGFFYVSSSARPTAKPCGMNEYSEGLRKQPKCTPCPPSTGTDPSNVWGTHKNSSVCLAPAGYYISNDGTVYPCPAGSFKSGYSAAGEQCTACADVGKENFTTANAASTSDADCKILKPGYGAFYRGVAQLQSMSNEALVSEVEARQCPYNHWCPGGSLADGYPRQCPPGMKTQQPGATSEDQCAVPPGFRFNGTAAVECQNGYYKEGWDSITTCQACGDNIAATANSVGWYSEGTMKLPVYDANTGSVGSWLYVRGNSSACYIRRGMGALSTLEGLKAVACTDGFYGTNETKRYGTTLFICRDCPVGQVTSCTGVPTANCNATLASYQAAYQTASGTVVSNFDARACLHQPGYGWVTTAWPPGDYTYSTTTSALCPDGYYSPGGHNSTCTLCPSGLMTGMNGAVTQDYCVAQPGFRYVNSSTAGIECSNGTYRSGYGGDTACTPCGSGLWNSARNFILVQPNATSGVPGTVNVRGGSGSCFILPGVGTSGSPGTLLAVACNNGSNYGPNTSRFNNTVASPCSSCPTYQVTNCNNVTDASIETSCESDLVTYKNSVTQGFVGVQACKFLPGYGYVAGVPAICPIGFYSPGGHNGTCSACTGVVTNNFHQTPGMTTLAACRTCSYDLILAADNSTCELLAGYAGTNNGTTFLGPMVVSNITGITECPMGWYCPGGNPNGAGAPQQCPTGLDTRGTRSSSLQDCRVISPGLAPADAGGAVLYSGSMSSVNQTVGCPAGYYCPGGVLEGSGWPIACSFNLTSLANASSYSDCNIIAPRQAPTNFTGAVLFNVTSVTQVRGTTECPKDYYCVGNASVLTANGRPQACPGGLQTDSVGKSSATACVAPPGYYYASASSAVACPDGTYAETYNTNSSCTACASTQSSYLPRTSASNCYTPMAVAVQSSSAVYTTGSSLSPWQDQGSSATYSSVAVAAGGANAVKIAAAKASAAVAGDIMFSSNGGQTWMSVSANASVGPKKWVSVAITSTDAITSSDAIIAVAADDAAVYKFITADGGATWNTAVIGDPGLGPYTAVAINADASRVLAAASSGSAYGTVLVVGSYSGTWSWSTGAAAGGGNITTAVEWTDVAVAAQTNVAIGNDYVMVAIETNGDVYTSTNSTFTFTSQAGNFGYPSGPVSYTGVATNSAGNSILVSASQQLYVASYATSWTWATTGPVSTAWQAVALSSTGQKLLAAESGASGGIYYSLDAGVTWNQASLAPSGALQGDWKSVALAG